MTQSLLTLVACLLLLNPLQSQNPDAKKEKWDVYNPPGPFKEVEFELTEGTWMNLDVSPDGKEIVFDLLGDIYIMPMAGGEAKLLRGGLPYEVQPRFSPDGKKIIFTSDAAGGDNIWIMNRDGSGAKEITKETFRLLNNAVWSPDGNYFVARKHFTSSRSLGAGEMWMYHISGGEGIQLTKKKNDQQDAGEPCFSKDGRYIYFSEDVYPGGYFQYNKDPNSQIYIIRRFDRETGDIENLVYGPGGAVRPQISPDGKLLSFIRRVREKSVLYLHHLETGEEWPVYDELSKDQQEAWAIFGVYPNYSWMPDGKHIIIWAKGKIRKVNIENHQAMDIPFKVKSKHRITEALRFEQAAAPEKFPSKMIRHAKTSPDGKILVFNAAGYLWKKQLPDGKPERLTKSNHLEFDPSFSADGNWLIYVSWHDEELGSVMKMNLRNPGAQPQKVITEKGIYGQPVFSSDGKKILFIKEGGNDHLGFDYCKDTGIYMANADGSDKKRLLKRGSQPVFSSDGKNIYFLENKGDKKEYTELNLDTRKERTVFQSKYTTQFAMSHDNKWLAFTELYKLYVIPFPAPGLSIELSSAMKSLPLSVLGKHSGINLHWTYDNQNICWTMGDEYFSTPLHKRFTFLPQSPDSVPAPDSSGIKINLELKHDIPDGMIAFKGARIITINNNNEVIENGTILIEKNKIKAIGTSSEVNIPGNAKVIDVSGKTIIPGIVDVHAHLGTFRHGMSPQKQWQYYANLAYGVTTTHDPSSNSEMVFSQSEMVKTGTMIGPRIFSTGTILYGAEGDFKAVINSLSDARFAIKRTADLGAFSVKSYNQPRRNQRQQVIQAAREQKIMVYPEGGSFFFHNLTQVLDGHTGVEHNLPVHTLYDDVIKLWGASKTGNTPTLIVGYGGITGENYWYQKHQVWENKKLLQFTPRALIDSRARHRTIIPDEEYETGFIEVSRSCKKLSDAGVKINLGSHGQIQGIGAHWELWMLQMGGMTNMEALRCATYNGAYYIGMEKEIGSLENGKLADLVVLEKNPLDDIRNSESVIYTMVNGRLFDAETMNETGNYERKRSLFFWERKKYSGNFHWHAETNSFSEGCGVQH
jgi:imidazolonepropionase-like amidohydrolase/Tol biopolymer transport system component